MVTRKYKVKVVAVSTSKPLAMKDAQTAKAAIASEISKKRIKNVKVSVVQA